VLASRRLGGRRVPNGTSPMTRSVELGRDRSYQFPMTPDALWAALSNTGEYRSWWPWLTDLDAEGLVAGAVWHCTVPPLPYALRFAVHLDNVARPTLVTAHISGDIVGTSRLVIAANGTSCCDVQLTSTLAPSSRTLGMLEPLARPIIRRAHNWVIDTGARQFLRIGIAQNRKPDPRASSL
jgi:hypothetical protein